MHIPGLRWWRLILATVVCLTFPLSVIASDEPTLTKEQIEQFLLTAKVVKSQQSNKGITNPWRLTLTDGTVTHDASFQAVDEHKARMETQRGTELGFVDSYKYNIAAYRLAELLGIDDLLPVYVERSWKGNSGSLSWWLPVKMDEVQRHKQKLTAPDPDAWNNQMYKVRVFDQLVYDTDANLTNVLIGEDWKIWRVDFSRAFRLSKDLKAPEDLQRCANPPSHGPVFKSQAMEDKWDIYFYDGYLYFTRSWTGDLVFRAEIRFAEEQARIALIETSLKDDEDQFVVQQVDFLIKSHLLGLASPHPLPKRRRMDPPYVLATFSLALFGRRGLYGTFEDTLATKVKPHREPGNSP